MAGLTFFFVPVCFYLDAGSADPVFQNTLGVGAWLCLIVLLAGEDRQVRAQVGVAIAFATLGEHFASIYMEGYIYRFKNVPAFVPPGHGLVYLTAVVLARSDLFSRNQGAITLMVLAVGSIWSIWGLFFAPRHDAMGFVLFLVFALCLFTGPSPRVYLGAFFITTWLELVGTYLETWAWVTIDPASGLPQGNPPSGVAAWYCLVDAVAIGGGPVAARWLNGARSRSGAQSIVEGSHDAGILASLRWCINHAKFPLFALIIIL
ncbi:MAG: hypothetical protein L0Y38_04635 [Methylococcaceae bacterium]|nr:hypothetical protein [Methylococcaceae bacterium]MCI0733095.1 hypothetical protein [Methylococcaceae bacterium]